MSSTESWSVAQTARVADEIRRLRGKRSAQWLSDATEELGYRVSRATISELETRRRKHLTVAELCVLAEALDVAPVELLYPHHVEIVDYLPGRSDRPTVGLEWFAGLRRERVLVRRDLSALMRAKTRLVQRRIVQKASGGESDSLPYEEVARRYPNEAELDHQIAVAVARLLEIDPGPSTDGG